MKFRTFVIATAALTLAGCEDSPGLVGITGRTTNDAASLSGRWVGQLSSSAVTFPVQAVLDLTQIGGSVTGTLTIDGSRTASFAGTLSGTRLTGSWSFNDVCGGGASTTADLLSGTRLSGTYNQNDCQGLTTGGYQLDRQTQ